MSELESTVDYLTDVVSSKRKTIFMIVCLALFCWLLYAVKEVTTLVLTAYAITLLLDPVLRRLQRSGISRGTSVVLIGLLVSFLFFALIVLAVPPLVQQYRDLIQALPYYVHTVIAEGKAVSKSWLGVEPAVNPDELITKLREHLASVGIDQVKVLGASVGATVLRGYSLTLTIFNLLLLPCLIFYIAKDLQQIHRMVGSFLRPDIRMRVQTVGTQILTHVYAFFKGQITVACLLGLLYALGLWLVGLPSAFVIGILSGVLNVVPYLGVAFGLIISTVLTIVGPGDMGHLLLVWSVFAVVQALDAMLLTPKIVGESVGIHPLGVMLALIVGGKLLGLLGLVIAIPAAAAIRVLFNYLNHLLQDFDDDDARLVYSRGKASEPGS